MSNLTNEHINFAQTLRKDYRALIPTAGTPDPLASVKNFKISVENSQQQIPVRCYTPTEQPLNMLFPMILFIHGGGWVSGDLDTHDVLIRALSLNLNAVVLSVDYRLAPEFNAFDQIEDAYQALHWFYQHAAELKGNTQKLMLIGDSAGGAIAANLAHKLRDEGNIPVAAQWLMYPVVSANFNSPSFQKYGDQHFPTKYVMDTVTESYLPPNTSLEDSRLYPIHAEHHNLSPTFISVAGLDPLTSTTQDYAAQLTEQQVKNEIKYYENQEHGFIQFFKNTQEHPLGQQAFNDGITTLKEWLDL
jgi:acetyl esterase